MHSVDLNSMLDILLRIWGFMVSHGFIITIGGESFLLSYSILMIGGFCIGVIIDLIHKIWWEE